MRNYSCENKKESFLLIDQVKKKRETAGSMPEIFLLKPQLTYDRKEDSMPEVFYLKIRSKQLKSMSNIVFMGFWGCQ
ncbi:hypothetical protein [Fusibacter bizertensis]